MDPKQFLHERDIMYVVNKLHSAYIEIAPPFKKHTYRLSENRSIDAPSFKEQREILKSLREQSIIEVSKCLNKLDKPTSFEKAWVYEYKRTKNNKLKDYYWDLLLKRQEGLYNHDALIEKGTLVLHIEGQYIYVVYPYHALRINRKPLKNGGFPQILFEHLINKSNGETVTQESLDYTTSRSFIDIVNSVGFTGIIRSKFIPEVTKKSIRLLREVEMNVKDSTKLYRQLIEDPFNKELYENYLENIDN